MCLPRYFDLFKVFYGYRDFVEWLLRFFLLLFGIFLFIFGFDESEMRFIYGIG